MANIKYNDNFNFRTIISSDVEMTEVDHIEIQVEKYNEDIDDTTYEAFLKKNLYATISITRVLERNVDIVDIGDSQDQAMYEAMAHLVKNREKVLGEETSALADTIFYIDKIELSEKFNLQELSALLSTSLEQVSKTHEYWLAIGYGGIIFKNGEQLLEQGADFKKSGFITLKKENDNEYALLVATQHTLNTDYVPYNEKIANKIKKSRNENQELITHLNSTKLKQ